MTLADLFVIHPSSERRGVGVFITPQSVVAFPVATSVVVTAARAARTIGRMDIDSIVVPLVASFICGAAMFLITVREPRARPRGSMDWCRAIVIAASNSLMLFAAALGIDKF
jgi:hypothetical protein